VVEVPCVPRCLAHIINTAEKSDAKGWWYAPNNLVGPHLPDPVVARGLLHCKRLWDVHNPSTNIACPCIFKSTVWAQGSLLAAKFLHAFDVPLSLFGPILAGAASPQPFLAIAQCILLIVVMAVLHAIWGHVQRGGGVDNVGTTIGSWGAAKRLGVTKWRTRGAAERLGALLQWVKGAAKQLSASKQHVRRVVSPASSLIFSSH
jgi:hypothetical protein